MRADTRQDEYSFLASLGIYVICDILGLTLISTIIVIYHSSMGLRYGVDSAFHLKLLVAAPVLTMSGRLGIAAKRLTLVMLVISFILLDARISASGSQFTITAAQMHVIRIINIGLTLCNLAFLLMHYFRLVAEQQVMLEAYATTDPLSGLANRRHLLNFWTPIEASAPKLKFPVSIALCDIDHFKSINDRFGHDGGDEMLRRIGPILKSNVREEDCACRWGGEEFLLIMPRSDLQKSEAAAERICQMIAEEKLILRTDEISITATFGVAQIQPGESLEGAIARTDQALYLGKTNGRNLVVVDDPSL